jgi:hypothetical protein
VIRYRRPLSSTEKKEASVDESGRRERLTIGQAQVMRSRSARHGRGESKATGLRSK